MIRVHVPGILYPSWLDVLVLRDRAGGVEELSVSGGRVKGALFRRAAE